METIMRVERGPLYPPICSSGQTEVMTIYDPLTEALREAAARGQTTVELGFGQIEGMIGRPLPASSDQRQWWANSSHSQALAWRAAGFHVEQVYPERRRVRFARGEVGGSYAHRSRIPATLR